jgi:hypothetical protein
VHRLVLQHVKLQYSDHLKLCCTGDLGAVKYCATIALAKIAPARLAQSKAPSMQLQWSELEVAVTQPA